MNVWTIEQSHRWFDQQPYRLGANFLPSTAINQLEMWQAETFDPETIDRELSWAAGIGMNAMRVYLHDLLWEADAAGFADRIDRYLEIAASHGIDTMFVLFDDCWNREFALGPQPAPKPSTHNSGWVQSPGVHVVNDPSQWDRLERYTTGLMARYATDERVFAWDLYNEPGNGEAGDDAFTKDLQIDRSLPLLEAVFDWARSVESITQPLTCGLWNFDDKFANLNRFQMENSDITSFHCYLPPQPMIERLLTVARPGRPLICTEYMARGHGSTFAYSLPLLKKFNVGAINWGLVSGKSQTIYPWGWTPAKGKPEVLFHDVFHPDGSFLYPMEKYVFDALKVDP